MDTNAGRSMVINEYNKWYYFAYVINGCDISCDDIVEAIVNLVKHVKTIYSNDDVIDISNFEHMSAYDGIDACSLLSVINTNEIRQGVIHGDLSTMYFVCDTDTIKGGEN